MSAPDAEYLCPCFRCPRCGGVCDDDWSHPEDGLAGPCQTCRYFEWWAHVGPHRDGRHIRSAGDEQRWRRYDDAVAAGWIVGSGVEVDTEETK